MRQQSTIDACEKVIEHINELNDQKKIPLVILFDIQEAFDSVAWYLIIDEMKKMTVPAYLIHAISSYLSNRKNQMLSTDLKYEVKQGCPQGSILGPTLWLVLFNPLLTSEGLAHVFRQAFADDLVVTCCLDCNNFDKRKATTESLTRKIFRWGRKRHLTFNESKTQVILITKKYPHPELKIEIGKSTVEASENLTYLDFVIDKNLNCNDHVKARIDCCKGSCQCCSMDERSFQRTCAIAVTKS